MAVGPEHRLPITRQADPFRPGRILFVRRKMKTSEAVPPPGKPLMPIVPASDAPVFALVATRHYTAKGTPTWVITNDRVVPSSDRSLVRCPADIPMSVAPRRE